MNMANIEKIEQEIELSFVPYWEITFDFIKIFAKEKNTILENEEVSQILKYFREINKSIYLELYKTEKQNKIEKKNELLELQENISLYKNLNILDWTNKFDKDPSPQEVRTYIKKLVEKGKVFETLCPDWFIDIKGNRKKRDHILKSSKREVMNKKEILRHNKYIAGLEELINNSLYLSSRINEKSLIKPDIEKYHYFRSCVKIGSTEYRVILHTEQYKGEREEKPQTVHLYDVLEVSKKTSKPKSR